MGITFAEYQVPWICYEHGFITLDKAQFFGVHMVQFPHYQEGTDGNCERCNKFLPHWKVLFRGLEEPVIILCPECIWKSDSIEIVLMNRKSVYPKQSDLKIK